MKGLEISEIKKNDLENFFDLSSEYYKKDYLNLNEIFYKKNFINLGETSYITDGEHGSPDWDKHSGIKYITAENIKPNYINETNFGYISKKQHNRNSRSIVQENDILVYTVGAYAGFVAKAEKHLFPANIPRSVAIIRNEILKPEFLSFFLNCKYGIFQSKRFQAGNSQPMLALEKIKQFNIVLLDKQFQILCSKIYNKAYEYRINSKKKYAVAEALLLQTLGLNNFNHPNQAVSIKSFNESFGSTGRLDAEYYQPKYENLIAHIKNQTWCYLSELVNITKSIEPGSSAYDENAGVPFYRVSDYSKAGLSTPNKKLQNSFVKQNQKLINSLKPKKNTILFSKDGSIGNAYLLTQDLDGITSGAILHLNVKDNAKIIPEYLTLLLNSNIVKLQAERDAGGSIILHWSIKEIENVIIPIIDLNVQNQIADLIKESFTLKEQSEHLLEVAKKAVEIAIEQNETIAIDFIDDNS